MPSVLEKQSMFRKTLGIVVLSGLMLAAAIALFGRYDGSLQKNVDTFLTAGFLKYAADSQLQRQNGGSIAATVFSGGPGEIPPGDSPVKIPASSKTIILVLCLAVWLTLSLIFILRPHLLLAGSLIWIGGVLTVSFLLLFLKGILISPAQPLLATILLFPFLLLLGRVRDSWERLLRLQRRDNFQQKVLESLADAVESRDPALGGHIVRMQHYVRVLADRLVRSGLYTDILTPDYCQLLVRLTPLHDIGKVASPEEIILKPGRLTEEEFEEMKKHVALGEALLLATVRKEEEEEYFALARAIITAHHERWDGNGYPLGLSGEQIPLAARILAVADVYDALISKRCYKEAYSHEQSRAILMKGRGSWFDPAVAEAFKEAEEEMWRISQKYQRDNDNLEYILP